MLVGVLLAVAAVAPSEGYQFNLPPGTGVINVKDHGAKGDGIADDTEAIRKAIAFVFDNQGTYWRYSHQGVVFFPAGTYKVSGPIESRASDREWMNGWRSGLFLLGENRDKVVIQLADNAPGYNDKANPRPVIKTGSEWPAGDGNAAFRHNIINLTVDVGRGNPGAVAIDYLCHNRGCVEDVLLRAPEGSGFCGLEMTRPWPGPAMVKRVEVQGFDHAIRVGTHQHGMTFEHIKIRDPRVSGIESPDNLLAIRGLDVEANVTAIVLGGGQAMLALLDSALKAAPGTPAGTVAIQSKGASYYLRDVKVEGYAAAMRDEANDKTLQPAGGVLGFAAHPVFSTKGGEPQPLRLPIKETPEFHSENLADWVSIKDFPADDPADSLQQAIDSGKPIVYIPNGRYDMKKTVILRGNVRKVIGFAAQLTTPEGSDIPTFRVEGGGPPVTLEHLHFDWQAGGIVQAGSKPLAMRHVDFKSLTTAPGAAGDIFTEDTMGRPIIVGPGQSYWGRQVNCEFGDDPLIVNHGNLWILGYKTEWQMVCLDNRKGGRAELLGALFYPLEHVPRDAPMFRNEGGVISACWRQNGGTPYHTHLLNNGEPSHLQSWWALGLLHAE